MKGEFVLLINLYFFNCVYVLLTFNLRSSCRPCRLTTSTPSGGAIHHGPAAAPDVRPGAALVDLADVPALVDLAAVPSTARPPARWRGARRTPCLRSTASLGPSRSMPWGTPQGTRQGTGRGS